MIWALTICWMSPIVGEVDLWRTGQCFFMRRDYPAKAQCDADLAAFRDRVDQRWRRYGWIECVEYPERNGK